MNRGLCLLALVGALPGIVARAEDSKSSTEKILIITAEQTGIFNTGGLGHTTAGLGGALREAGEQVDALMPFYSNLPPEVLAKVVDENIEYRIPWGNRPDSPKLRFSVHSVVNPANGVKTFLLKAHEPADLFDNPKLPGQSLRYTNRKSQEEAMAMFSKAAAAFVSRRRYTMVNAHDWHCGLVGHYLKEYPLPSALEVGERRVLFTISNLGYQGMTPADVLGHGGPHPALLTPDHYEFYGSLNMMKAGILDSDAVLTVSENYLRDIQTPRFGHGLDGFLRWIASVKPLLAIRNGADTKPWVPTDFTAGDLGGKTRGKVALQASLGLEVGADKPLFVMTSRLANQKGYDYLPGALDAFLAKDAGAQAVIMGDGDPAYVEVVKKLQAKHGKRLVYREFSAALERPITQYADYFVNVPWYEPSGTNQMFAMAAGTPPIVSDVGGLPNYVTDGKTGLVAHIHFRGEGAEVDVEATQRELVRTFDRASAQFRAGRPYRAMAARAMRQDNTWKSRIPAYRELFARMRLTRPRLAPLHLDIEAERARESACKRLYEQLLPFVRRVIIHDTPIRGP